MNLANLFWYFHLGFFLSLGIFLSLFVIAVIFGVVCAFVTNQYTYEGSQKFSKKVGGPPPNRNIVFRIIKILNLTMKKLFLTSKRHEKHMFAG